MYRFLFSLVFGLLLFTSCSSPTNEKKALRLIEPEVKSHLLKPKSYKFSEMRLDSCFSDDPTHNPEMITFVIKLSSLYNEYKEFKEDAEHALDMKALYSSIGSIYSENDNNKYNKYQKEYEIAKKKG